MEKTYLRRVALTGALVVASFFAGFSSANAHGGELEPTTLAIQNDMFTTNIDGATVTSDLSTNSSGTPTLIIILFIGCAFIMSLGALRIVRKSRIAGTETGISKP